MWQLGKIEEKYQKRDNKKRKAGRGKRVSCKEKVGKAPMCILQALCP